MSLRSCPTIPEDSRSSIRTSLRTPSIASSGTTVPYYAMAYYPPTDKAGTFHKIEVKVSRPGVTVRARQGYVTPKPAAPASRMRAPSDSGAESKATPEIRDALGSPLPVSGLALKVFAAPFKGSAPNASVVLGVEIRGRDLRLNPSDKLVVTYTAVDAKGKIRTGSTNTVALTLKPETRARVAATGLRLLNRVDLPPGRYQLRDRRPRHRWRRRRIGFLRSRCSRLREDAVFDQRPRAVIGGCERTDGPAGRGAAPGAPRFAGGGTQFSAERRRRTLRRGLRQPGVETAQGGHHDDGDNG